MTKIIDGYASITYLNNKSYNTVTANAASYRKIGKSMNTMGGAQFTYQYWMKVEDANDDLFKNLVVLLKGDKRKYNLGYYNPLANPQPNQPTHTLVNKLESQYAVACPLIKFGNSYRDLNIMINTNNNPIVNININMNNNPGPGRQNLLSLLSLKSWYLFTFVFQDNFSIPQAAEDGIKFSMYVNDSLYVDNNAVNVPDLKNNSLRQNDGNLNIFPDNQNGTDFVKIGNINYYNYAVTTKDVIKTFQQGPPTTSLIEKSDKDRSISYLTAYNKIDIFNY
jgi:hypothetical protein